MAVEKYLIPPTDPQATKLIFINCVTTSQKLTNFIKTVSSTLIICQCRLTFHLRQDREKKL